MDINLKRIRSLIAFGSTLLITPAVTIANEGTSDAFLAGYLTAILEKELGWEKGSYHLDVRGHRAMITLQEDDVERRNGLEEKLMKIENIEGMNIQVQIAETASESQTSKPKKRHSFLGLQPDTTPFPTGDLFWPLIADPKQPQFFASYRRYDTDVDTVNLGAVGYGETFGLYRHKGKRRGDSLQLSIAAGLFAQFNLDAPSKDLINADYVVGFPLTYRYGPLSARLRVYHQSSHLGDEFLLNERPERVNLSFESVEFLVSYDWNTLRIYLGGERLIDPEPSSLNTEGAHGGLEYRGTQPILWGGHLVGGLDLKSWEEHDWSIDLSLKIGLEFGRANPGSHRLRLMGEAYDGHAPHGQFYNSEISYYGAGIYLGF